MYFNPCHPETSVLKHLVPKSTTLKMKYIYRYSKYVHVKIAAGRLMYNIIAFPIFHYFNVFLEFIHSW